MTLSIGISAARLLGIALATIAVAGAHAQDADERERRATEEIRYLQNRIQQTRGRFAEFITTRAQEHDGFVKDDMAALNVATEKEVALIEKAIAEWRRGDDREAHRWRVEADHAVRRRDVWFERIADYRDKQHDAAPTERSFTWEMRMSRVDSLTNLFDLIRAKRAVADAWGKLAEATAPGADKTLLDRLQDAALTAVTRREMAEWKFNWASRREELLQDKRLSSHEIAAALAGWDKVHAERLRLREADIARDQRLRELQRAEKKAELDIEVAIEAAREPDPSKRWRARREELSADETITPAKPLSGGVSSLPEGWRNADIGAVRWPGGATGNGNAFTLRASGWGAWGPDDAFHFVCRELDGDGQIIAHLASVDDSHGKMAASVMIRESVADGAMFAGATIQPNGEVRLSRRMPTNAPQFLPAENISAPRSWIRLTRRGDVLTAYSSTDGKFWQQIESRPVAMKSRALIGVAAWTTANTSCGELKLDSVQIIPGTPAHTLFANADPFAQGVVLRDGAKLPGTIRAADTNGLTLVRDGKDEIVSWSRIARLVFNPAPADFAKQRTPGVLLTTGEFVEGDLGVVRESEPDEKRRVRVQLVMRTLLFGERTFDAARDVIAVVVDPRK